MLNRYNLHLALALIGTLALSGCSNIGERATLKSSQAEISSTAASTSAIEILLKQAEMSRSPQKEHYLLQAAYELYYQEDYLYASEILELVDTDISEMGLLIRRQLLAALIAEQQQQPQQVLDALQPFEGMPLGDAQQAKQLHQLRINAYQQLDMPQQEAEARIGIMAYLNDDDARLDNFQQLLDIALLINQQLEEESQPEQKAALQQQLGQLLGALEAWRYRYHSKLGDGQVETLPEESIGLNKPNNIAVLLPLSGRHADAAEAIQNGILSAYFNQTDKQITLRFYDTEGDSSVAWQRYHQALSEGAEIIIGPLTKESVNLMASSRTLEVPVLALNHSTEISTTDNGLYQFALSPENEATQVAIRAWNQGLRSPVVLVPDNNWGQRIQAAFNETWQLLGGKTASEQHYDAKQNDFSQPIRAALELDLSDQRLKELRTTLHQSIKFTPRRRQDVDFIFIAAQPRQARLLRPQLKFHYAGSLPVFSTSHAYQGKPDPQNDRDMDDIIFGDAPWTLNQSQDHPLQQQILAIWPRANEKFWRLYAMGIDAFELTSYIQARPVMLNYYGETGHLQMTHERRLYRQLQWATFHRGIPVALEP